jgi:hypothetical protein
MICPDCIADSRTIECIFDAKQMGEVCPECERVFSIFNPNPNHFHYATERGVRKKMLRDRKMRKANSVGTTALVDRILRRDD